MPNPGHFAERATHYYLLGLEASNSRQAESLFGLTNLFFHMSEDLRVRESTLDRSDPKAQRTQGRGT
jgi:hypothetical protein